MNSDKKMIEVKNLSIGYVHKGVKHVVLRDINFNIKNGQMVALVGPNGAGKSTLLKALIGILKPFKGEVKIFNDTNSLGHSKNKFSNVGFAAQSQIIDWYTNTMDNVILGPLLSGLSNKVAITNTKSAMKVMEISDLSKQAVDHLSGGQQQRVQVARELARHPKLYILDEPTTGLDIESAEKLFGFLREEARKGASVIVSSHDLTIVEEYMEYLLLIDENQLLFNGLLNDFLRERGGDQETVVKFGKPIKDLNLTTKGASVISSNELRFSGKCKLPEILNMLTPNLSEIVSISTHTNTLREQYLSMRSSRKKES